MITNPEEFRQRLLDIQNSVNVVYSTLPSDEPRFIIDANSRTINIPIEFQFLGVKNDHNAETVYFEIDRYFDDEDLSKHTCVIQFSDKNNSNDGGIYPVTTMDTTSVDGKIIFGWEIKNDVTSIVGDIYFSVRFYSIDSTDYTFTYNFNTLTAKSSVLDTHNVDNKTIIENYPSELQTWMEKMDELSRGTEGKVEEVQQVSAEAIAEINAVKESIPEDYNTLLDDVDELKSDLVDLRTIKLLNGFNKDNVTDGGYWNSSDGTSIYPNSGYHACNDYVMVKPNTKYSFWDVRATGPYPLTWQSVCWYDINKNFISGLVNKDSNIVTLPTNARYARVSFAKTNTYAVFTEGETLEKYYPFGYYKEYHVYCDKPLKDVKIDIIGDSWSAVNDTASVKYTDLLDSIDGADVNVLAVSGTGFYNDGSVSKQFYIQAESVRSDSDIVFIFGSFNDIGKLVDSSTTLGNVADSNTTTICGCINTTINKILEINPTAKILFATPGSWGGYNANNDGNNSNNHYALEYVEAIKNVCYQRGYECKDMLRSLNLRPWITSFKNDYQPDGCHPNNAGHEKYLYPVIKRYLESAVC